ncbi:hypothetical protein [Streptococcus parauberis]|uniref:Uncharacterized protein n=1 Tax=Streptococcus parauberis NCFD 2020 TaxID=873447 RepID=F1YZZ3_9STRE|nr:hypothetical protein [Streptococcus parauberis]EGE54483.1 hypothetical protein SPB_1795 [Streptococcus parauberis NCFD 2020]
MYNLEPKVINHNQHLLAKNVKKISQKINKYIKEGKSIVIETYPGVDKKKLSNLLSLLLPLIKIFNSEDFLIDNEIIEANIQKLLDEDRVFGRITNNIINDFFSKNRLEEFAKQSNQVV